MERRLAAILAADVVGYSRLMEADEEATVDTLHACRQVVDALVADHHGRVFGSAGDSVLAEFPSPVEAVRCAVNIQRELEARDADLPEGRRMRLRIGVNLGDVIVEGDDLLGDGVNIASRLESLADPGGISLSRPVFDQIRKQLELGYEYLGAHEVKNIAEPVHVYRVLTEPEAVGRVIGRPGPAWRRWAIAASVAVLIGASATFAWLGPWQPAVQPASVEKMAFPLPEKPSLAVLPFDNLSRDAAHDHVADGLTEDIITAVSQISSLFVIARGSTFVYKDEPVTVQQVAEDLGVRYVLEGSVRASEDQVRISAQLIDALTGQHLWAERYDRPFDDIFALQDEITDQIVLALRVRLTDGEEARVHRLHTRSIEAWNLLSRGREHFYRVNRTDNERAREFFQRAVEVDGDYALGYALLAATYWQDAFQGWGEDRNLSIERASQLVARAQALDDALPDVYALKGAIHLFKREYDLAIEAGEMAVARNPNHASNTALLGLVLHNAGRPEDAIRMYTTAMRLGPYYPDWFLEELGFTYLDAGRPEEALIAFSRFLDRDPAALHAAHAYVGMALAQYALGEEDTARANIARAVQTHPAVSLSHFRQYALNQDRARLERGLATMRRLGLPE